MRYRHPRSLAFGVALCTAISTASAQTENSDARFGLGEIVVVGQRPDGRSSVGGSVVTREENWTLQKLTLEQSLSLVPGVNSTPRGRRNEYDILVRGFDRLQVPLMVSGAS